jgi:cell division transport system permease protein
MTAGCIAPVRREQQEFVVPASDPEVSLVRPSAPIVPRDSVTSRALFFTIAIMTFIAALIVGTIMIVHASVSAWQKDMSREVTIQIRPLPGRDVGAEIDKAIDVARRTPGIADVRAMSRDETGRLLEPWLGTGVDLGLLPLPRLIIVRLGDATEADLAGLRRGLSEGVAGASLDDHRNWSGRLAAVSDTIIVAGFALLGLVLAATVLSVSFATRGAVSTNRPVVEVLHLVGSRDDFIASTFQRHFFAVGIQGGLIGGLAAALLFAAGNFLPRFFSPIAGAETTFLTGQFALDQHGYLAIAGIAGLVALVTTVAARLTVRMTLRHIE